jgi:hypothetical protein
MRRAATSTGGVLVCAGVLLCACGGSAATPPPPTVIEGTPTQVQQRLVVTLQGQPTRTFGSGHWHVCDHGTVSNPSPLVAHDVRVVVTYYDHGAVEGRTTRADALNNGGALGDIAAGASHAFTVCGYARNEPDDDVVSAAPAP